jgi:chromatin remodeling complex protein RSC6
VLFRSVSVSPELCRFLNISEGSEISRTEVTRYIIQYIQERNLVHPEKKTMVVPDEALGELLGPDVDLDTLTRFTIQKYMNKHFLHHPF